MMIVKRRRRTLLYKTLSMSCRSFLDNSYGACVLSSYVGGNILQTNKIKSPRNDLMKRMSTALIIKKVPRKHVIDEIIKNKMTLDGNMYTRI